MKKNWTRKILGGLSLTSALFVFQACYGTPQDFGLDVFVEGRVTSQSTGLPIKGIKVSVADHLQYEYTDDEGLFSFYTDRREQLKVSFEDIDAGDNGTFLKRDTTLTAIDEKVFLDIKLDDQ